MITRLGMIFTILTSLGAWGKGEKLNFSEKVFLSPVVMKQIEGPNFKAIEITFEQKMMGLNSKLAKK